MGNSHQRLGDTESSSDEESLSSVERTPPESMLVRTVSAATGLNDTNRAATREDLLEEGVPSDQVDRRLTQNHLNEITLRQYMWVLVVVVLVIFVGAMCVLVGLVMTIAAYLGASDVPCNVPLLLWCKVQGAWFIINTVFNQPDARTGISIGQQLFCCYAPPVGIHPLFGQHPLRVKCYSVLVGLFQMSWCAVGIYWVAISGRSSTTTPCYEVQTQLCDAILFYAVSVLIFSFVMIGVAIGLMSVIQTLALRGVFGGLNPAPPGSVERNTEPVPQGDARLAESTSCSVCMEAWEDGPEKAILQTKTCGHCFHKACLQQWLGINRNCPLCRGDLGVGDNPANAGMARGQQQEQPELHAALGRALAPRAQRS